MNSCRHITESIEASPTKIYEFVADGNNLTKWASGLAESKVHREGEYWICDSPMGQAKVQFAPRNSFGILDHDVTLPNGIVNHNPLRVMKNGSGSEVTFTLFRLAGVSDSDYAKDATTIGKDLATLKKLMESN